MMKKKIAILGASYLQKPLVEKAKTMGLETHVFAWKDGNVVESICDFYYDISILAKEEILNKCKQIKIDGIVSIASDIAMPTVNYIAKEMDLVGNTLYSTLISTDKYEMRKALAKAGIRCPHNRFYTSAQFQEAEEFQFPVIVKPTDRSGSRGVTKVIDTKNVDKAIEKAIANSIAGKAIVEEFIDGKEFSVEGISVDGKHEVLAITDKVTTGAPYFVEIAHHQPAQITERIKEKMIALTYNVLDALEIKNGASHTEIFLNDDNKLYISEAAGRMGGDWIGSHITPTTSGFDYLKAVISIALGEKEINHFYNLKKTKHSGVYFLIPEPGKIESIKNNLSNFRDVVHDYFLMVQEGDEVDEVLDGSGKRSGVIFYKGIEKLEEFKLKDAFTFQIESL